MTRAGSWTSSQSLQGGQRQADALTREGAGELHPRVSHLDWGGKGSLIQVVGSFLPGSGVEKGPEGQTEFC